MKVSRTVSMPIELIEAVNELTKITNKTFSRIVVEAVEKEIKTEKRKAGK